MPTTSSRRSVTSSNSASTSPPPRSGAQQDVRRIGAGTGRDDAPARTPVALAIDGDRVPDVHRDGPGIPPRSGRASHGALPEARRRRSQGAAALRAVASGGGAIPGRAGAEFPAAAREADGSRARGAGRPDDETR